MLTSVTKKSPIRQHVTAMARIRSFPPPAPPELPGEHVHGGRHQALHTDKLWAGGGWVRGVTAHASLPSPH